MFIDWNKIILVIFGSADEKTKAEVEAWKMKKLSHKKLYDDAVSYYQNASNQNDNITDEQIDDSYLKLMRRKQHQHQMRLRYKMAVAASIAVLVIVGTGCLIFNSSLISTKNGELTLKSETESPAVIILANNGQVLTPEQLITESSTASTEGDNVSKKRLEYSATEEPKPQVHTIKIPRGTSFELVLSDGTFIMLSPESSLTYPVSFKKGVVREVTLSGEAYFDVTKSSDKFVVNTNKMKLQVYGTKFNINSRGNRPDQAVLLEGIVGICAKGTVQNEEVILKPGQMSKIAIDGKIQLSNVDITEYKAKREGYILFNGKSLREIAEILELLYDVKVKFESLDLQNIEIIASVKNGDSLTDFLETIEYASRVKFVVKGKEVYIRPK